MIWPSTKIIVFGTIRVPYAASGRLLRRICDCRVSLDGRVDPLVGDLQTHREQLAKFLAAGGPGSELDLLKQVEQVIAVLELIDRVEVFTRGDEGGLRLAARIKLARPLRK